jgi:Rhodanese-related sulfurtransferase
MGQRKWILGAVAVVLFAVALVLAMGSAGPSAGDIDNSQARSLIDDGVRVVDVRTAAEYSMGHIPGSENVPLNDLTSAAATWDVGAPVLVYCATGDRSQTAVEYLNANGFTQVYNLTAGIVVWDGELATGTEVASVTPSAAPAESGLSGDV